MTEKSWTPHPAGVACDKKKSKSSLFIYKIAYIWRSNEKVENLYLKNFNPFFQGLKKIKSPQIVMPSPSLTTITRMNSKSEKRGTPQHIPKYLSDL